MEAATAGGIRAVSPEEIKCLLPHRGSALLLNGGVTIDVGSQSASSSFRVEKRMCRGHFPNHPLLPGWMISEMAAQLLGVTIKICLNPEWQGELRGWELTIRRPSVPGDRLVLWARLTKVRAANRLFIGSADLIDQSGRVLAQLKNLRIARIG